MPELGPPFDPSGEPQRWETGVEPVEPDVVGVLVLVLIVAGIWFVAGVVIGAVWL